MALGIVSDDLVDETRVKLCPAGFGGAQVVNEPERRRIIFPGLPDVGGESVRDVVGEVVAESVAQGCCRRGLEGELLDSALLW